MCRKKAEIPTSYLIGLIVYKLDLFNPSIFMARYLDKISIYCVFDATSFGTDDIILTKNFSLYNEDDTLYRDKIGGHFLCETGKTKKGEIIVSSWGEKYIFDGSNSKHIDKILIKMTPNQ